MISICIPVFNSEKYLRRCLDSLANQTFKNFEVIVVDDCSAGVDENGWNCKKICKVFSKQSKIKINYTRNSRNLGCIDSRRNGTYEAKGEYVFFIDSDDSLEPDCLEKLNLIADQKHSDIIHCGANVIVFNNLEDKYNNQIVEKTNTVFEGNIQENLFDISVLKHQINFYVWGKLIKKDVLLSAWEHIPYCYCVWGEDYLIYLLITYYAKSYTGTKEKLYNYSAGTGISASNSITTLEQCEKICSVASAFTIVADFVNNEENNLTEEQKEAIQRQCNTYCLSTFRQIKNTVSEDIKQDAFNLFCDYWGSDYVENILKAASESF